MASFSKKLVHQLIFVLFYTLLWRNNFQIDASAREG
jgi:hypothetical protein